MVVPGEKPSKDINPQNKEVAMEKPIINYETLIRITKA